MAFGIGKNGFILGRVRPKVRISRADSIPMVSIQYGIVIHRRNIVTKGFRTIVPSVDIYPLRIVLTLRSVGIVVNPLCEIVITYAEKTIDIICADKSVQHLLGGAVLEISIQTTCVIHERKDTAQFLLKGSAKTGSLQ